MSPLQTVPHASGKALPLARLKRTSFWRGRIVTNAAIAEAAGIPCWHGSGCDLGVTETAYLHGASVACNGVLPSDVVGSWTRADDLIAEDLRFEAGHAFVPTRPGLGCELDMDALERYRGA